ncbi:MAG TPA: pantoate--beta-alanine ligase [Vicinamibacterales bacterium]
MRIISTPGEMSRLARAIRREGSGRHSLVPTMGALHEGHFSLVRAARDRSTIVTVSIFVNPTQFGPNEDLARYPRTFEADCAALQGLGVDYVFAPAAPDMYPDGFRTSVHVDGLRDRLEGQVRPGHFDGVATVVLKLFAIAQPDAAFFGRKDAQQLRIIRQMTSDLDLGIEIVGCPIVREPDGLAGSSRNAYLSPDERRAATVLSRALRAAADAIGRGIRASAEIVAAADAVIKAEPMARPDYVELVDADTFDRVGSIERTALLLLAVRIGSTRLIDNAVINVRDGEVNVER